jgi:hypothetical protein
MEPQVIEVRSGVLHTFDGEKHEVQGGVYLSPEAYLSASGELDQLRRRHAAASSSVLPALVVGTSLLGLAVGYWLGRRGRDE